MQTNVPVASYIIESEPGIAQAWLMATVGPKIQKGHLRKSVNEVSIPKVCEALQTKVPLLLRVSSNLLYGLSLLYKQKVGFMASDMSLVHDRLKYQFSNTSIFSTAGSLPEVANVNERKRGRMNLIKDDMAFDLERDFAQDWNESLQDSEFLQNVAKIQQMDTSLFNVRSCTEARHQEEAEARDRLFNDYMNRTNDTTVVTMEEELADLDFEFDENGDIATTLNSKPNERYLNILGDLNLDEDYTATVGVLEDLSRSVNSITNDPNYVTTLNQSEATIVNPTISTKQPKKRRLVVDHVLRLGTRNSMQVGHPNQPEDYAPGTSLRELILSISTKQPHFVNLCYHLILGPQFTDELPSHALPLAARHPNVNHIESFLREIDDIERGRDVQSRRPSLSFIDGILGRLGEAEDDDVLGLDLSIQALSPMEEEEDLFDPNLSIDATKKLKDFEQFLRDRTYQISMREEEEDRISTFENLIPSANSRVEDSVSNRIAAQSFLYILELATRNVVKLTYLERVPTEASSVIKPIEIAFF